MNILKKLMQRLCGCGKHDDRENGELLTAQLRLGPADILESDENGIIPEQDRVITQVVILDADKSKRAARTVLTGMCYSVGSATRQGSSSPTRFIGQSAMTSRT